MDINQSVFRQIEFAGQRRFKGWHYVLRAARLYMLCLLAKKHPLLTLVIVQKDHREVGATSMRMEHRMML